MIDPDQVDRWRIFPRLMLALYGVQCWRVGEWFMALSSPSVEQSAFVATIWGAAAAWFGLYVNSGPNSKHRE
ncbi:MAG: hypothetical protein RLN89_08500 [Parvibaculum sp.]